MIPFCMRREEGEKFNTPEQSHFNERVRGVGSFHPIAALLRLAATPPFEVVSPLSIFRAMRRSIEKFAAGLPVRTLLLSSLTAASNIHWQHPAD